MKQCLLKTMLSLFPNESAELHRYREIHYQFMLFQNKIIAKMKLLSESYQLD